MREGQQVAFIVYTEEHKKQEEEIWKECFEKVDDLIEEANRRGIILGMINYPCENYTSKPLVKIING